MSLNFIRDHSVRLTSPALEVAASGYYAWHDPPKRAIRRKSHVATRRPPFRCRTACCKDSVLMETFFHTLNVALVRRCR